MPSMIILLEMVVSRNNGVRDIFVKTYKIDADKANTIGV